MTAALRWLKTSSLWTYRTLLWATLTVIFLCAAVVLGLRYWLLPNIDNYRDDIARAVSSAARQHISIGHISGNWDGLRPRLVLENVIVYDKADRPALELSRVDSTLSWQSLAVLRVSFHALDIYRPVLDVRRDGRGVLWVAGIEADTAAADGGGFGDWLLAQPDVEIHDATLVWNDEQRMAPELRLSRVNLQIVNRGKRHRFGLTAEAPAEIARGLDVRGDLRGASLQALSEWNGRLFVQLDHVDIAAWRQWLTFPVDVPSGRGAVRSWLTFNADVLTEAVADVKLANVRTRLGATLPELELDSLDGRFAWKQNDAGIEIATRQLALATGARAIAWPPTDALLRLSRDRQGTITGGELQASRLDLAPLVALADRLPLGDAVRKPLAELEPRGAVSDLALRWKGDWPAFQTYGVRLRVADLAINRREAWPAFAGITGTLDASEKGGTLTLTSQKATFDLPTVFRQPLALDQAAGEATWTRTNDGYDVRVNQMTFANVDGAGSLSGQYLVRAAGDELDFAGGLTRADLHAVPRYLPVKIKTVTPWLERALVAGKVSDVKFRVKGRAAQFPYADPKTGVFTLHAKVANGTLNYHDDWPRIENIDGEVAFRGHELEVDAKQATILGAKVAKVRAALPDMESRTPVLTVTGEAEGPTSEFLAFVNRSPLLTILDRFTEDMRAQGRGRLALKLTLPLANLRDTRVAGTYTVINNHLVVDSAVPPIDQANGRIEFTEAAVRIPNATGIFLGGPVTANATTQRDGVIRIGMTGRINADAVRKLGSDVALMQHLRGATDWRGAFVVRRKAGAELVVESSMQGMASDLPAPLNKTAADAVAWRLERRTGGGQERVGFSWGNVAAGQFVWRDVNGRSQMERGVLRFGGGAAGEPDRPGVVVNGAVRLLDFDAWLKLLGDGESGAGLPLSAVDVKIAEVEFAGRRFHDVALSGAGTGGTLQLNATAREFEGAGSWRAQNKGRFTARLKRLTVPPAETRLTELRATPATPQKSPDLPALDIVADNFQWGAKQLGRLELQAVNENRDWRIEKLRISNPDSTLAVDGVWQGSATPPRTAVNVRFDVSDIGRTLTRWGYPEGVRRGTAKIEGTLNWNGSPQDFDYPTLGGNLVIDAAKGQFAKLDPGLAKLLGILSLQALPRRITLDFRDIFSEGFAFDAILGAVKIQRGVASTENLRINGPSAHVVMNGTIDLARETQNLRVKVSPHLSDGVSIAGALLGGPVAGVAAFLAQKILKDPLDQMAGFDYRITGTWSDPQVVKLEPPRQESTP